MPTRQQINRFFVQVFTALAYLFTSLQWLWFLVLGLPAIIETGFFEFITPAEQVQGAEPIFDLTFSPVVAIATGVMTLVFLLVTLVILIKLPKTISDTGDKIISQTTEVILPILTNHKKLPAKKKRAVSKRITIALQILLVIIPLIAAFFIPPIQTITSQIITTLAIWLAGLSILCFCISWLLESRTTSRTR